MPKYQALNLSLLNIIVIISSNKLLVSDFPITTKVFVYKDAITK